VVRVDLTLASPFARPRPSSAPGSSAFIAVVRWRSRGLLPGASSAVSPPRASPWWCWCCFSAAAWPGWRRRSPGVCRCGRHGRVRWLPSPVSALRLFSLSLSLCSVYFCSTSSAAGRLSLWRCLPCRCTAAAMLLRPYAITAVIVLTCACCCYAALLLMRVLLSLCSYSCEFFFCAASILAHGLPCCSNCCCCYWITMCSLGSCLRLDYCE
jgi:hypothetical protein